MGEAPPELLVSNAGAWRQWLDSHAAAAQAVWLVLAKKGTTNPTDLSYEAALEEALCHGWIDGRVQRRDTTTFRQHFGPRRPTSSWSESNVRRVETLLAQDRMAPAGIEAVSRAKANGRWANAYRGSASIEVPQDLTRELERSPAALAMFQSLSGQNRYAVLYRIGEARRPETRARRIRQYVDMLAQGGTLHPQADRPPRKPG